MAVSGDLEHCTRTAVVIAPHQLRSFKFTQSEYGDSVVLKRSLQPSLVNRWPWLHNVWKRSSIFLFVKHAAKELKLHGHDVMLIMPILPEILPIGRKLWDNL